MSPSFRRCNTSAAQKWYGGCQRINPVTLVGTKQTGRRRAESCTLAFLVMVPAVGSSSPPIKFSNVDFPMPADTQHQVKI